MKSPIVWLPSLMVFGCVVALAVQALVASPSKTQVDHDAEIRQLRQELNVISVRLEKLEADEHRVVPHSGSSTTEVPTNFSTTKSVETASSVPTLILEDVPALSLFRETAINFSIDGYYGTRPRMFSSTLLPERSFWSAPSHTDDRQVTSPLRVEKQTKKLVRR